MLNAKPKLLIIGSRGFLGGHAARIAAHEFAVTVGNRTVSGQANEVRIDITDRSSVAAAIALVNPDVVLLLAAHADIDYCQQHPEEARSVNLDGAGYVAEACAAANAKLVFTSTGAVFDGLHHGYTEEWPVSPVSVYGETKARAEERILGLLPDAIIVRLPLVIGFAVPPAVNGFLDKFQSQLASGKTIAQPVFEQRNPIDAAGCCEFIFEIVRHRQRGIFHIGCKDSVSRYELGVKLAARMGYTDRVREQLEVPAGRAPRGPDHFLLTDKLSGAIDLPIPTCDEVIERCFDGIA